MWKQSSGDGYQSTTVATVWGRSGHFKLFWLASIFLNVFFRRTFSDKIYRIFTCYLFTFLNCVCTLFMCQ